MATKLGIKCKLYRNTGTWATPSWVEVKAVSDFSVNVAWDKGEANTRESRVKFNAKTQLDLSWSGKLSKSSADASVPIILAAIVTDAVLDVMILDGDKATNGVTGYRCEVQVFSGTESQGLGDLLYPEIDIMPSPPSVAGQNPQSVLVTTGAPAFTDIAA